MGKLSLKFFINFLENSLHFHIFHGNVLNFHRKNSFFHIFFHFYSIFPHFSFIFVKFFTISLKICLHVTKHCLNSLSSIAGVAPPSFLAIQAGQTLNTMTSSSDAFSMRSMAMLVVFAFVSLLPVLFKKQLKQKLQWKLSSNSVEFCTFHTNT